MTKLQEKANNKKSICHVEITEINLMPRVWRSAIALKQAGYNVSVIGYGNNTQYEGIQYLGINKAPNRIVRILNTSKQMVEWAAKSDAYIIELHSPELLLYYKKLKRAGKKIVFNSHEFYSMQVLRREYIPTVFRKAISSLYMVWEKHICRKIDCIIYPCMVKGRNPFESYKCRSAKIENYSSSINVPITEKEPRTAIYAGSLSEDRGCLTMIEAFNQVDGTLYLAGDFSSEEFKNEALKRANPKRVVFLGSLSREELFLYYSKVCVGLSLLKKEGQYNEIDNLSTKIYEYMSIGMPVVASDMDYAKRINKEYNFGILVDPNNLREIIDAIETVFNHSELVTKFGENGKKAIEEKFNWNEEKKKLVELYSELSV